ncbi:response regulator transcription factor [Desulfurobacterium sp.]
MKEIKVAVVEDDIEIANILKLALSREGYRVRIFDTSEKLLNDIIEYRQKYDVVILDIMLPGMEGRDACKFLRERGIGVPILILTALSEEEDKIKGFDSGADDYITKPFSVRELIARVKALLRRGGRTEEQIISPAGDGVKFFDDSRTVEINGNRVYLTKTEFAILKILVENAGRAVRKDELVLKLGGRGSVRAIDVHVKNLREKLGNEGNKIKTVWGIGYRFEQEDSGKDK